MNHKNMLPIFFALLCLISGISLNFKLNTVSLNEAWADDPTNPDTTDAQRATLRLIWERFGINCCVNRNGVLTGLFGDRINLGLTSNDPVERVYQFLERNRDLLNLENPREELLLKRCSRNDNGTGHVHLYQKANGIIVNGSFYHFIFTTDPDSQGIRLYELEGAYYPEARFINTIPAISQAQAESIAVHDPRHNGAIPNIRNTKLLIMGIDGSLRLVWQMAVTNGAFGGSAGYIIDAQSGAILAAESSVIRERQHITRH
jgi:hypothetical protein